jgi:hypothetical protein
VRAVRQRQYNAAVAGLIGIAPQDEIEGMIAAQLIAAHNATVECYRRAMIGEQTLEGLRERRGSIALLADRYQTASERSKGLKARPGALTDGQHQQTRGSH